MVYCKKWSLEQAAPNQSQGFAVCHLQKYKAIGHLDSMKNDKALLSWMGILCMELIPADKENIYYEREVSSAGFCKALKIQYGLCSHDGKQS